MATQVINIITTFLEVAGVWMDFSIMKTTFRCSKRKIKVQIGLHLQHQLTNWMQIKPFCRWTKIHLGTFQQMFNQSDMLESFDGQPNDALENYGNVC